MRDDLLGLDRDAFIAWSRGVAGFADRYHGALHRHLITTGRFAPDEVACWDEAEGRKPGVRARLAAAAARAQAPTVARATAARDPDLGTTTKLALRLADGREVETVVIPMRGGAHATVCVSSQVGCRMGCAFCRTARMGLVRDLSAAEIVGQVVAAAAHLGATPRNVVFMGMGEPLDNLDAVAAAVRALTDPRGFALAHRHVTISTVGRVDRLARLAEPDLARVNLAVSVSAADDALRDRLMPVNRAHGLLGLRRALVAHPLPAGRRLLIAYVLIDGVNDAPEQAAALADWVGDLRALVNLIPFNAFAGCDWRPSPPAAIAAFAATLRARGVHARVRATKGDAVLAACGQLGDGGARRRVSAC